MGANQSKSTRNRNRHRNKNFQTKNHKKQPPNRKTKEWLHTQPVGEPETARVGNWSEPEYIFEDRPDGTLERNRRIRHESEQSSNNDASRSRQHQKNKNKDTKPQKNHKTTAKTEVPEKHYQKREQRQKSSESEEIQRNGRAKEMKSKHQRKSEIVSSSEATTLSHHQVMSDSEANTGKESASDLNSGQKWSGRNGTVPHSKQGNSSAENTLKRKPNGRSQHNRISHKAKKEMVEKEKRMQRVTKEQLRSMSATLRKTAWYLGRNLGMSESQVQKIGSNFATEYERKYQILLWWRRTRGWGATIQKLVILLELAEYDYEEYKSMLTSSNDGDVTIYDKPPDLPSVDPRGNNNNNIVKKEFYHEVTKNANSYRNMNYDDIMPAKASQLESAPPDSDHKSHHRGKEHRKQQQQERRSKNEEENSLWRKPRKSSSETEPQERIYDEVHEQPLGSTKAITQNEDTRVGKQLVNRDRNLSNESHTDDSGILTSSNATSPKLGPDATGPLKVTIALESTGGTEVEVTDVGFADSRSSRPGSQKILVVRRCSDSAVKLSYASNLKEKMQAVKTAESPIKEYESADELGKIFPEHAADNANDGHRKNSGDVTKRDATDNANDGHRRNSGDVTKRDYHQHHNVGRSGDSDITEESYASGIKSVIQKYETLTRLHQGENRDSMASATNWDRNYFPASTLPRNSEAKRGSKFTSQTSLQSSGSHNRGSYTRHGSSRKHLADYVPRYSCFIFGGKGKFPSRFKGLISGLAVFSNGDIVTSDSDNKRVQIFDWTGKFQTTFDTNTALKPKGLCITPQQNIAVCCGNEVHEYDRDGRRLSSFGQGIFRNNCYCVCCDIDGNYYVTDIVSHTISVHDPRGRIRKRFGFQGKGMAHFNQPVSLAISSKNHLYITDSQNHCVKVYTLTGRPLYRIGAKGSSDGLFWNPLGLCLDDNDHLYVADCGNNRVSQFGPSGNFLRHVLTEEDGVWMPSLVQTTVRGQLVVCEWERQSIKVFNIETEV